jgi:nucleoside-diphosphate-sugar epimerase
MAGIDRIQQELGYRVDVGFEEGIDRTVQWYQTVGLRTLG